MLKPALLILMIASASIPPARAQSLPSFDSVTLATIPFFKFMKTAGSMSYELPKVLPFISQQKTVWSARSTTTADQKRLLLLLHEVAENGTEDITGCFIPRHAINLYRKGKIVECMLVCFECDGVRLATQRNPTRVKSIAKREAQMKSLSLLFEIHDYRLKPDPNERH